MKKVPIFLTREGSLKMTHKTPFFIIFPRDISGPPCGRQKRRSTPTGATPFAFKIYSGRPGGDTEKTVVPPGCRPNFVSQASQSLVSAASRSRFKEFDSLDRIFLWRAIFTFSNSQIDLHRYLKRCADPRFWNVQSAIPTTERHTVTLVRNIFVSPSSRNSWKHIFCEGLGCGA